MKPNAEEFVEILEDLGFDPQPYSGRYMFGKQCVSLQDTTPWEVARKIPIPIEVSAPKTDALGKGTIVYWPDFEWPYDEDDQEENEVPQATTQEVPQIKISFNGDSVVVKKDGVEATVAPQNHPNVKIWDYKNRYSYFAAHGAILGDQPTKHVKVHAAKTELARYWEIRGTVTNWTENDFWLERWTERKNEILEARKKNGTAVAA